MAIKNSRIPVYLSLLSAFALFAALSIQQARADEDSAQPVGSGATMADRLAAIEAQNRQILQALNAGGVGDSCCNGGACGTGGTCSAYNCYSCCDLAWIITADAIVWQRSRPNGTTLLLVNNAAQTDPLVNAADLDFNFEPGTRVSIARRFSTGCELEVNYFGIDDLEATARPGVSAIFPIPGAGPTDPVRFHGPFADPIVSYTSRLHSLELNATMPCGSFWKMLIGFRTMELSERLLMEDVASPNNFYEADTHNHLYGLQAGAIVTPLQWGRFRMDAGLKAGALVNIADSRAHDSVIFVFPSDRGNDLAFFGEASITAVYQATDHIGLRMGYQMAALDGVALAPDQVATHLLLGPDAGTANIALGGTVLYQGGFAGLELTW